MIVINRNGKTQVYTGWQEWMLLLAAFVVFWLALALMAFVFVGVAITIGIMLLLVVPAAVAVAAIGTVLRR